MLVKIRRIFGGHYFEDEAVAIEPDFVPGPNELPDCTFVVELPGETVDRYTELYGECRVREMLSCRSGDAESCSVGFTAADLVACATCGAHGVKLVESIVMPSPKGEA